MENMRPYPVGRGAGGNLANRFGGTYHVLDLEQVEHDAEYLAGLAKAPTTYFSDRSRSVVTENDSPDVPFRYSLNPYRGCAHGCSYCYARPTHEYLGWDAGLDFETRILVKQDAPALFRGFLARTGWNGELIAMSGVTDPYQPAERKFMLTRGCLEVAASHGQPISLITKNALVLRDLDLLHGMASRSLIHVNLSITTLDDELVRCMEPRSSTPAARLRAVKELAEAGVPVRVLIAPVIPGLTESEIPAILSAAREAGAGAAGFQMLRLPQSVVTVFLDWLERAQPGRKDRILGRIRATRGGKLSSCEFGERMRGSGEAAERIGDLFRIFSRKHGLDGELPAYVHSGFRPPPDKGGQLRLF